MTNNSNPLDLMSKYFHFTDKSPVHPSLSDLGVCRVVAVVAYEDGHYDLGISDGSDPDMFDFFPLGRLDFDSRVSA